LLSWFFANDVLFFLVERFIEFYGNADQAIADLLGLWRMTVNRRGALWGFSEMFARTYLRGLLNTRLSVVYVVETGHYLSGIQAQWERSYNLTTF
jgi:hypothetical protein